MPERQLEVVSSPEIRLPFCTLDVRVLCCWRPVQQQMLTYWCPDVKVQSWVRENTGHFGGPGLLGTVQRALLVRSKCNSTRNETSAEEVTYFHDYYSCSTLFI